MIPLPFKLKRPLDGCVLKIIAVVSMLIDHYAAILLPHSSSLYLPMRAIGRIAFPIFAFLVVEGARHTSDIKRYALRMLVFAIIAEIPFDFAHIKNLSDLKDFSFLNISSQNVFFTLFLGVLMLWALKYVSANPVLSPVAVFLPALLAHFFNSDYKACGIVVIFGFYIMGMAPLAGGLIISFVLAFGFESHIEAWGILAFIPILLYNGKRGHQIKYLFYGIYPVQYLLYGIMNLINLRNAS